MLVVLYAVIREKEKGVHHYHVCDVFLSYVLLGRVRSLYKKTYKT